MLDWTLIDHRFHGETGVPDHIPLAGVARIARAETQGACAAVVSGVRRLKGMHDERKTLLTEPGHTANKTSHDIPH